MKIIKSKILSEYNELIHGVSSKIGLGREAPFYFNMSYSVGDDKNIERSPLCTYEENYLHSFRRDKEKSGRMFSVIMMREED